MITNDPIQTFIDILFDTEKSKEFLEEADALLGTDYAKEFEENHTKKAGE